MVTRVGLRHPRRSIATVTTVHPPRATSSEDAAQRQVLQRRVAALSMTATAAVCAIDLAVWWGSGDVWKLSIAVCMAVLTVLFGLSIVLTRRGRGRPSLWFMLSAIPVAITWVMVVGGAATIIPTLIAALAMVLMLPDTIHPGFVSPRRWMSLLLTAYLAGIGLRLLVRGLDFASSPAELAIIVLVPGTLVVTQWLLIQRIFRAMRATLGESEALRREHEQHNRELVASQAALERASAAKSQFLANMSHELRTPLNIILGYTEILQDDLAAEPAHDPARGQDLARIHAASLHLLSLISDVLDLSKVEAGKAELSPERFSLVALTHEVAEACQPLIQRKHNRLRIELDPEADELHTDRLRLRQILLNLLSNAAKFTDSGDITLRTHLLAPDRVRIDLEDTGIGISAEAQGRVFEAFEQADSSSTRLHGGTGLGLTLVRQFARLLGGDVTLESAPGHGSLFRVTILRRTSDSSPITSTAELPACERLVGRPPALAGTFAGLAPAE